MKKISKITSLHRLNASPSGNPRWRVSFEDGTSYLTLADAACNYGIENAELKDYVEVTVEGGRITYLEPACKGCRMIEPDGTVMHDLACPVRMHKARTRRT